MSQLQLSAQLIDAVQDALTTHDESAGDSGVATQYLAAIIGFLLAKQNMPAAEKSDYLDQLSAFTRHVMQDVERQQASAPQAATPQEAYGVWKPGDA